MRLFVAVEGVKFVWESTIHDRRLLWSCLAHIPKRCQYFLVTTTIVSYTRTDVSCKENTLPKIRNPFQIGEYYAGRPVQPWKKCGYITPSKCRRVSGFQPARPPNFRLPSFDSYSPFSSFHFVILCFYLITIIYRTLSHNATSIRSSAGILKPIVPLYPQEPCFHISCDTGASHIFDF